MIPLTLGLACDKARPVATSNFILLPAPEVMPIILDGSPLACPECVTVNGQVMFKITERDFVAFKRKLKEFDKHVRFYLRPLLGEPNEEKK